MKSQRGPTTNWILAVARGAFVLCLISALWPFIVEAQRRAPKRVLGLYWYGKDFPTNISFDQSIQSVFSSAAGEPVEYYVEYLESNRFPGEKQSLLLRDYLRQKYAEHKIDVVIALSNPSVDFLLKYRDELFPGAPIVYHTFGPVEIPEQKIRAGITGVVADNVFRKTLDLALKLHPTTQEVLIISASPERDRKLESEVKEELRDLDPGVTLTYLTDLPLDELLAKVRNAPERSVVLYVRYSQDEPGKSLNPFDALTVISQESRVPVYSLSGFSLRGRGSVGGYGINLDATARKVGEMALQITRGVRPQDLPVVTVPSIPAFDQRQLRRWGISEEALPPGSLIEFKDSSFWKKYKAQIIGLALFILFQSGLIAFLLIERSRRQRATRVLSQSEERFSKAFRANPQPMSVTTLDSGRYVAVNRSFLSMSGYERPEVLGRTSLELNIWESPAARVDFVKRLTEQGSVRNLETHFRTKDGSVKVLLSAAELLELDGEHCILMASSDITERKQSEQWLSALTARLLRTQDEERRHIARELHDVTAQSLGLILLNLAQVQKVTLDSRSKDKLAESAALGEQALREIRTLSYVLHPPLLDQAGLITALRWYVKGFSERSGISVEFSESGNDGHRMPPEVEYSLFRVVQECLTNIRRHTNSETAAINLVRNPEKVVLEVRDRGTGIKLTTPVNGDSVESVGVGILGMRHRLHQLGGELTVESATDGTTVTATVPVKWVVYDSYSVS